jgi:hypothetical protein
MGVVTDSNGLLHMRARFYNPEIKRFINIDPIRDGLNWYAYANGNPISLADPFGLSPALRWDTLGHSILSVLGTIPVVGFVFDVANAVWYFSKGETFNGVCSLISAIPGVGSLAGRGMKAFNICSKYTGMVVQGSRIIGNLGRFAVGTNRIATVVFDNLERYIINGEPFSIGQLLIDTATITLSVVAVKGSLDGLKDSIAGFNFAVEHGICFVAGTLITTADGFTPIEEIQVGDLVWASNPETGETDLKPVVNTFINKAYHLIHITVDGQEISTTSEHPFWVPQKGWIPAIALRAGDELLLLCGRIVIIEIIQHEILENPITVYNFEVEDFHTYFVTEIAVLVHNTCETKASDINPNLKDMSTMTEDEALKAGMDFVGEGYFERTNPGDPSGIFVSADKTRQFRMTDKDLLGLHPPGVPHVNFEILQPVLHRPGKANIIENIHILLQS